MNGKGEGVMLIWSAMQFFLYKESHELAQLKSLIGMTIILLVPGQYMVIF